MQRTTGLRQPLTIHAGGDHAHVDHNGMVLPDSRDAGIERLCMQTKQRGQFRFAGGVHESLCNLMHPLWELKKLISILTRPFLAM